MGVGGILTRTGWMDPLFGLDFLLRLQTFRHDVTAGFLHDLEISGTGYAPANGSYKYQGHTFAKESWAGPNNFIMEWVGNWSPNPVWFLSDGTNHYLVESSADLPPSTGWSVAGGAAVLPGPTIVSTEFPKYTPFSIYQDVALTLPALDQGNLIRGWRDELSGSGRVAIQSSSTACPSVRFIAGKPVPRFDGVDDYMRLDTPIILTGDFTVTARVRSSGDGIIVGSEAHVGGVHLLRINASDQVVFYDGMTLLTSTTPVSTRATPINISVIRTGTTVKMYEGTTEIGSGTSAATMEAGIIGTLIFGGDSLSPLNGDGPVILIAGTAMTDDLATIDEALSLL